MNQCELCKRDITQLDLDKFEKNSELKPVGMRDAQICSRQKCREKYEKRERKQADIRFRDNLNNAYPIEKKHLLYSHARQEKKIKHFDSREADRKNIMEALYTAVEKDRQVVFQQGIEKLRIHVLEYEYGAKDLELLLRFDFVRRVTEKMLAKQISLAPDPESFQKIDGLKLEMEQTFINALGMVADNIEKAKTTYPERIIEYSLPETYFHHNWLK